MVLPSGDMAGYRFHCGTVCALAEATNPMRRKLRQNMFRKFMIRSRVFSMLKEMLAWGNGHPLNEEPLNGNVSCGEIRAASS